jgi:hypothetical protein
MSVQIIEKVDGNHQISFDAYWGKGDGISVLREALPINHEEHLYTYIKRELESQTSKYKPEDFGIEHPLVGEFKNKTRSELIDEIMDLRSSLESKLIYG